MQEYRLTYTVIQWYCRLKVWLTEIVKVVEWCELFRMESELLWVVVLFHCLSVCVCMYVYVRACMYVPLFLLFFNIFIMVFQHYPVSSVCVFCVSVCVLFFFFFFSCSLLSVFVLLWNNLIVIHWSFCWILFLLLWLCNVPFILFIALRAQQGFIPGCYGDQHTWPD